MKTGKWREERKKDFTSGYIVFFFLKSLRELLTTMGDRFTDAEVCQDKAGACGGCAKHVYVVI